MNFDLTSWHWVGLSSILFCLELFVGSPGVILLGIGMSCLIIAAIISVCAISFWVQLILLAVLSFLIGLLGRKVFMTENSTSESSLNRLSKNLIGMTLRLEHSIKNGQSRVRINDTIWRIEGPDLLAGTQIEVVDVKGNTLIVDRAL